MPSSEVDRLYQLPLAEFTAARNQLAKTSGDDGAAIKALEKPNIAAWAVNQLFWTKRKIYDALIAASEQVRAAHVKQLSGKSADVAAAEAAHHAAVKAAADESRRILAAAGDPATTATMSAVIETLQTLPTHDEPGKLTRPLKPLGFEALAGFVPGVRAPRPFPAPPKKETKPVDPKVSAREAAAHEKAAAKHRADAFSRSRKMLALRRKPSATPTTRWWRSSAGLPRPRRSMLAPKRSSPRSPRSCAGFATNSVPPNAPPATLPTSWRASSTPSRTNAGSRSRSAYHPVSRS